MRSERGSASLIGVLLALALIMVMLSIAVPSAVKQIQVTNENAAAVQLAQINAAESTMGQTYGEFLPPQNLTGSLPTPTVPISCKNPMLASGAQVQVPAGYTMQWAVAPDAPPLSSPASSCSTVAGGVSAYQITLDPISPLSAQRHFFACNPAVTPPASGQCDGAIHFNANQTATVNDPVYPIATPTAAALYLYGSGTGGSTPSCPAGSGQSWNGSACVCPSGQSMVSGVCTPQLICQTNETKINGACYLTFPSPIGYPANYFYQVSATFNNTANFAASVTGTGLLTFQFTDPNTIAISGQISTWTTDTCAWNCGGGGSLPSFGSCLVSGVISLSAGGTITFSGEPCYVQNSWPVPAGGMLFSAEGLSFSFPGGQLTSSSGFQGQSSRTTMLLNGALNPMPN